MYFVTDFLSICPIFCIKSLLNMPICYVGPNVVPPLGSQIFPNQSRFTANQQEFSFLSFFSRKKTKIWAVRQKSLKKCMPHIISAELAAFFPSLVYGVVENKGGEKGSICVESLANSQKLRKQGRGKRQKGEGKGK